VREIVVGSGGRSHYPFAGGVVRANSEVRNDDTYGILRLTLRANRYEWEFVPEAGRTFTDSGSDSCH
jgi:acid phosphatase type 7